MDINNYDYKHNEEKKPNKELRHVIRKEPNLNNLRINDEYKKGKDECTNELESENSFKNSITAFDSLKNYRKPVSQGNSRNNIRIYNRNNHEINNCNKISYSNNNYENRNIHPCKSDNKKSSINNTDGIKVERVNVTPRNEVNKSNGDTEPFNELFINKSYILKKFDKMMDDLGLTTEGRVTLMNLPLEKKWEIFKLQKVMIIYYIWLTNFIKYGGYYYLNKNIMDNVMKDSKTNKDWDIHEHLIRCIRVFFHIHINRDIYSDTNYVQSIFLSSPSVLPITNRALILDMLSYLTKIETPLGWNMVIDSLHWVSLGNGDKESYIEDINNRLMVSKEKLKQTINIKNNLRKKKTLKSLTVSSLTNIHKNFLKQPSFLSSLNLFSTEFSYHLAFSLLQEEYQLQGYSEYQDLNISHQKINTQNSNSNITSYGHELNSTSSFDLNSNNSNINDESQRKHDQALTFPRNRKISSSYLHSTNENNLMDITSTALSVPNLKVIENKIQTSKENYFHTEGDLSYNNVNNNDTDLRNSFTSNTMSSLLSESTIANNSINYLSNSLSNSPTLNDNEAELKKYSMKNQHNIKKVQVNTSLLNKPTTAIPRFCPFTFWMKDLEDCAKEYNQLFLGNNLSSKIIYNTIANKTYRWAPMISAPKETVDQEQAINYICENLNLMISIINNVPEETAQNRLAIIKCFKLCKIDKIFQKLSQSKNSNILTLINQCIQKDLSKNLEEFSLSIFQHKDYCSIYGSTKSIQKNKECIGVKNISRKILQKRKKHTSMNNIIDNLSQDINKNYNNGSSKIYNQESYNNIDDRKSNIFSYENYINIDKEKQLNYENEEKKSLEKIALSFNSLNIADSSETVNNDTLSSNKHLSVAHKSQVIGRSFAKKIMN
ncbi:hypothetical protein LY90DRAFT_700758 [Neocallimastix californiae]|uniref:Formin GTPase-binding domain-containing protein n=1 Tax=Neocallimastix californiae TaxID=1754190 RepID=A0A1Y2DZG7_9FUNG|nr:hypothetical protein LY90DRAFT_700758 [Neocallimastix californiae]|eukprot:ORY64661.1 hypothetical protein LY90DRAFT_700758 [Neocallimastix californiae]